VSRFAKNTLQKEPFFCQEDSTRKKGEDCFQGMNYLREKYEKREERGRMERNGPFFIGRNGKRFSRNELLATVFLWMTDQSPVRANGRFQK
jgi:hypothetical protein